MALEMDELFDFIFYHYAFMSLIFPSRKYNNLLFYQRRSLKFKSLGKVKFNKKKQSTI